MTENTMPNGQVEKDGFVYGCHCDLNPGDVPDGCVLDYGEHRDCVNAVLPSGRLRRSKWACQYWKKVTP